MKVDHISILVHDLNFAIAKFSKLLGNKVTVEEVEEQQVSVAMFQLENCKLELICPHPSNQKLLNRLAKHGEGIHHIAMGGIQIEMQEELNFLNVSEKGANGKLVKFLPPQDFCGTLLEIITSQ